MGVVEREHVVAALATTVEAFEQSLTRVLGPGIVNDSTVQSNDWAVWTLGGKSIAGGKLDDALDTFGLRAIRATVENRRHWRLVVFAPGQRPHWCRHWFDYLPATRPEPDEDDDGPCGAGELAGVLATFTANNCTIPDDLVQRVWNLNIHAAMRILYAFQASSIADALTRYGIPYRRERLLDALTGRGVTDDELNTAAGNLPRVLLSLGIENPARRWRDGQLAGT